MPCLDAVSIVFLDVFSVRGQHQLLADGAIDTGLH